MHALQIYSVVDNQPDGIASRFTANVTHLSINKDGSKIAAGSGWESYRTNITAAFRFMIILCLVLFRDMTIRVKDNNSKGNYQETIFDGHTAPILCVSLDPKSEYLVRRILTNLLLSVIISWCKICIGFKQLWWNCSCVVIVNKKAIAVMAMGSPEQWLQ